MRYRRHFLRLVVIALAGFIFVSLILYWEGEQQLETRANDVTLKYGAPDGGRPTKTRDSFKSVFTKHKATKLIVLWNNFYRQTGWSWVDRRWVWSYPRANGLCYVTTARSEAPSADAVVFHTWPEDMRPDLKPPSVRYPNQRYVFLVNETPVRKNYRLKSFDRFFNTTMTYRLDSDVPFTYGIIVKKDRSKTSFEHFQNQTLQKVRLMGKKKLVAWLVSHCNTDSQRELYVEELKKHIPIDIFGKCGSLTCKPRRSRRCNKMIEENYKFVLSFENSLCLDYVTEKVFSTLRYLVVPVVFGGANYTKFVPPKSVINVLDFNSARLLADYLKYLDEHDDEYMGYHDCRYTYSVPAHVSWQLGFQRLCGLISDPDTPPKVYTAQDLDNHWGNHTCYSLPTDRLGTIIL